MSRERGYPSIHLFLFSAYGKHDVFRAKETTKGQSIDDMGNRLRIGWGLASGGSGFFFISVTRHTYFRIKTSESAAPCCLRYHLGSETTKHLEANHKKAQALTTTYPSLPPDPSRSRRRHCRHRDAQVANFLSNLPAYRTGVSPLTRGVEVGLAHGFFLTGPFIKLGPLRGTDAAEVAGCLSGAGLVLILTACLSIYGATAFQRDEVIGVKTLSGRDITRDPVQSSDGWAKFTSGWLVGGLSGVAWSYILTQILPYYS